MSQSREQGTHPDVESALEQLKGQASLLVRQAHPDLRVHQQTVVQVGDALLDAPRPAVDLCALLALAPLQAVDAEQEAILGLHDVLLGLVAPDAAELDKVGRVADRGGYGCARARACQRLTAATG